MSAVMLDGKKLSEILRAEIASDRASFTAKTGVIPHLAAVLVGENSASKVYVRNKQSACEKAGLASTLHRLAADAPMNELVKIVTQLNEDSSVHGILVQFPLPKQMSEREIVELILPAKDVDCFHPKNLGLLMEGRPRFLPCTPGGIMTLLEREKISPAGKHVVILGRSNIVGRPLSVMLSQKGDYADATVTLCHSRTKDIPRFARDADILVAAIGKPEFVTKEMVKPGAVVIDVGINRLESGKIVGDVAFDEVKEVASAITPVPGGVGPMTVTTLLRNTLVAAQSQYGFARG